MQCRLCRSSENETLIHRDRFPIYIWPIDARFEQEFEPLTVCRCQNCGLVQLDFFDDELIQKLYSNEVFGLTPAKEFKTTMKKHKDFLDYCDSVMGAEWLKDKDVLDIGGHDFLCTVNAEFKSAAICDPNAPQESPWDNLRVVNDFFKKDYFEENSFDFIIAKHILEHVNHLEQFMQDVRFVLKEKGRLLIEVPDTSSSLEGHNFSLFYHQHLSYFDSDSLQNLLNTMGFTVIDISKANKVMRVVAEKAGEGSNTLQKDGALSNRIKGYHAQVDKYFSELNSFMKESSKDKKAYCYGAGAETVLLMNMNPDVQDFVEMIVDSSSQKEGKKIGGARFTVSSASVLANKEEENILINSRDYFDEIFGVLKEMGKKNFQYIRINPEFKKGKI